METNLIVEVCLKSQLRRAFDASEAATVEKGEVLERANLVSGIDRFAASQANVFNVICAKHVDFFGFQFTVFFSKLKNFFSIFSVSRNDCHFYFNKSILWET